MHTVFMNPVHKIFLHFGYIDNALFRELLKLDIIYISAIYGDDITDRKGTWAQHKRIIR